ncbi:NUDIX hydrolase [Natronomonas sp. EA1]|uniref:NUDIX hydrolase n=1 Tax=Natronomonas sp. EA1 TaxID=3421655 RepID=UPI003EC0A0B6
METTRHFVATVYVVCDGATALHEHERLGMWLPPGGHIDRDELPHEAALREAKEETGLDVELYAEQGEMDSETARSLPEPQHFLLEDINVHDGAVGHQHIDFVFYGASETQEIAPDGHDEAHPERWEWFTVEELEARADELPEDVVEAGKRAIRTVSASE